MKFKEGERVFVSGDSDSLYIQDYHVRVATNATVLKDVSNKAKKALLSLDRIDGDGDVTAMVMLSGVSKIDGIQLKLIEKSIDYLLYDVDGELYGTVEVQLDRKNDIPTFNGTIMHMPMYETEEKPLGKNSYFYKTIRNQAQTDCPDAFLLIEIPVVRPLTFADYESAKELDVLSENNVSQVVKDLEGCEENDYSWGIFLGETLIGYCTLGYADAMEDVLMLHPMYSDDALLLSDVFIKKEYRKNGYALLLVKTVIERRQEEENEPVFLALLDDALSYFYEKLGFHWAFGEEYIMVHDRK